MTVPIWMLLLILAVAAWFAVKRLRAFLAYAPDDPGRFDPWKALYEGLLRRIWDYLAAAGPGGRPLRIALVGARCGQWLAAFHRGRQAPNPHVVALLRLDGEVWHPGWDLDPIPLAELNAASVDAVLLLPFIDSFRVRQQLRQRHGATLHLLDLNRLLQFAVHFGTAVDRNTPLFAWTLEQYLRMTWSWLGVAGKNGAPLRLAVFGAGAHTQWLAEITATGTLRQPQLVAILDDHATAPPAGWSVPVIRPEALNPAEVDAILLSSDSLTEVLRIRCAQLYGSHFRTIDLYEALPPGPYAKL